MDNPTKLSTIGDDLERLLDDLESRLEPRAYDQALEVVQLVTELYGAGLARIVETAHETLHDRAAVLVRRLADDDLVGGLLMVHGLHPDGLEQRVSAALEKVRPFLGGHGGDVELLDVDKDVGAVHLRLLGSCDGCPSSSVTLRLTVERAILDAAPEITIIDVDEPLAAVAPSPVVLTQKPTLTFDPTTGCGAVL